EPKQREPGRGDHGPPLEREPLADGDDREPEDRGGDHTRDDDRHGEDGGQVRPAGLVLELEDGQALPGRERVDDGARREDDAPPQHSPDERPRHLTCRVKGAVRILPPTCVCKNSRQVPGTGTSTPTVSLPGVAEVPVTFVAPRKLVQPVAPGAQTCVWK